MDRLILRCGRYLPPAQADEQERLQRLERYVAALSAETEELFETCERLRRELVLRLAEQDE
jgi:NTP pyrophosphatase (non-canonical NTP hydrolase)